MSLIDINGETYEDHVRKKANDQGIIKLTGQTIQDAINNPAQRAAWEKNATRVKSQAYAKQLQGEGSGVRNTIAGFSNAIAEAPAFFGSLLPNDFMPGEGELFKDVFTYKNIYNKLKTDYVYDKDFASEQLDRELTDNDVTAIQNFIEENGMAPGFGKGLGYVAEFFATAGAGQVRRAKLLVNKPSRTAAEELELEDLVKVMHAKPSKQSITKPASGVKLNEAGNLSVSRDKYDNVVNYIEKNPNANRQQISKATGVLPETVSRISSKVGISLRSRNKIKVGEQTDPGRKKPTGIYATKEQIDDIVKLKKQGLNFRQITPLVGVGKNTVLATIKYANLNKKVRLPGQRNKDLETLAKKIENLNINKTNLNPNDPIIKKLMKETGFKNRINFEDEIRQLYLESKGMTGSATKLRGLKLPGTNKFTENLKKFPRQSFVKDDLAGVGYRPRTLKKVEDVRKSVVAVSNTYSNFEHALPQNVIKNLNLPKKYMLIGERTSSFLNQFKSKFDKEHLNIIKRYKTDDGISLSQYNKEIAKLRKEIKQVTGGYEMGYVKFVNGKAFPVTPQKSALNKIGNLGRGTTGLINFFKNIKHHNSLVKAYNKSPNNPKFATLKKLVDDSKIPFVEEKELAKVYDKIKDFKSVEEFVEFFEKNKNSPFFKALFAGVGKKFMKKDVPIAAVSTAMLTKALQAEELDETERTNFSLGDSTNAAKAMTGRGSNTSFNKRIEFYREEGYSFEESVAKAREDMMKGNERIQFADGSQEEDYEKIMAQLEGGEIPGTINYAVKKALDPVQKDIRSIYEDSIAPSIEAAEYITLKSEDLKKEMQKKLNPDRPVKFKITETPRLLTQNPLVREAVALPTLLPVAALETVETIYNGIRQGKKNDIEMEEYFPNLYSIRSFLKGDIKQTPDEQKYISMIDEINRTIESGVTKFGFSVLDLIASIPDAVLPTEFVEEVRRQYDEMDPAEPETFLGKLGSLAIEFGVPGSVAFKMVNRGRTLLKTKTAGKIDLFTQKTHTLKGLPKLGTQISNVSKRVGTTALSFGAADFVGGGPFNTLSTMFDDPLLSSKIVGEVEDTSQLAGKQLALANLRNRVRFGAEGAMIGTLFPLVGPVLGTVGKQALLKPALWAGSKVAAGGGKVIGGASYLAARTPVVSDALSGLAKGTGVFGKFLGKDIIARVGASAVSGAPIKALTQSFKTGNYGQLPDFDKWRMFNVTSNDPLERGLKRVDRFLQWFRDSGNQTLNHFYLDGTSQRFIKAKSREVEKYLDTIETKAYNLAKGFERRYDAKTTSPSGEQYLLEQVYEFIRGDLKLSKLPTEMQKPAQELKKTFGEIKQRFVNELPEGGGMRNALEANLDKYMRMSFATFRNSGYKASPEVIENATDFMVNKIKANENLLETAIRGSNKPREEAIRDFAKQNVDNILAMGKNEGRDPIDVLQRINNKIILDDDVFIKTGEELPEVIRKLLGEEINLRSSVMTTTGSLVTQTSNLKAWKQATKKGLDDGYLFDSFEAATKAGVKDAQQIGKIPGLGLLETEATVTKGGPLGLFASPEVVKTFAGTGGMLDNLLQNSVYQSIIAYKAGVQTGKTVFSPATQTRNFGSAAAFPLFNGHIGGQASVRDAFKITLDDIFGAGKTLNEEDLIKRTVRKIELGVLDEGIVASELNAILKDLKGGKIQTLGKFAEAVDNAKFYKTATRVYQGGDNVWKWYGHEFYMSQLKNAFKNLDDVADYMKTTHNIDIERTNLMTGTSKTLSDGVEEAAAYLLRETYPTYSKVPEVVQALRKLPLGNFVSFTSEILRTGFATSSIALKHIGSNNPVLREMGYRSLAGQAITLGALNEGVKGLGHALTDVSPTQVEAFKEFFGPDYMKYSTLIPTTNIKDGVFKVFDWSRYQPYDILSATASELLKGVEIRNLDPKIAELNQQLNNIENPDSEEAKKLRAELKDAMVKKRMYSKLDPKEIPGTVFNSYFRTVGPLWDSVTGTFLAIPIGAEAFTEAITGKTREGSSIWTENMQPKEKWDAGVAHFLKTIEPGIFTSGKKIYRALAGDVTGTGQPLEIDQEAFKLMGGSSVTIDVPGSFQFKIGDLSMSLREPRIGKGWYSTVNFRARGPEQLVREYSDQNKQAFSQQYEFYKLVRAAEDNGFMTKGQIYQALMDRIGNETLVLSIMNGRYTALSYGEKGLTSRMKKIRDNNPDVDFGFSYFLPIGALESEKRRWNGKAFSDFEIKPGKETEKQSSLLEPGSPMNPNMAQKTEIAEIAPLPQTPAPLASPTQTASAANPITGLTTTETALLDRDEQLIRQRQRGTV